MDEDKLSGLDFSKITEMAGKLGQWTLDTDAMTKKFNQDMDITYRAFNPNQEAIQNMHEKKDMTKMY